MDIFVLSSWSSLSLVRGLAVWDVTYYVNIGWMQNQCGVDSTYVQCTKVHHLVLHLFVADSAWLHHSKEPAQFSTYIFVVGHHPLT